jgi:hypothetical protein
MPAYGDTEHCVKIIPDFVASDSIRTLNIPRTPEATNCANPNRDLHDENKAASLLCHAYSR